MRFKVFAAAAILAVVGTLGTLADAQGQILRRRAAAATPAVSATLVAAVPVAASSSPAIPRGHKLLYDLARGHAAKELAKRDGISRAAARGRIDQIDDQQLHAAVQASPVVLKGMPVGGTLSDFLDWLASHGDQIMQIVAIIMKLLALFGI